MVSSVAWIEVLLQEVPVICYKQPDGSNPRSSETGHE
jgi:hypothetical protein